MLLQISPVLLKALQKVHQALQEDGSVDESQKYWANQFAEAASAYSEIVATAPENALAWYNLADPSAISDDGDFSFLLLTGAGKDDILGLVDAAMRRTHQPADAGGPDLDEDLAPSDPAGASG